MHPLSEGGQGHEGHLSTKHKREGAMPPPDWSLVKGRHPPPAQHRPYFFFFLAAFFFFAIRDLTSSKLLG
jgi:hypothetical protein